MSPDFAAATGATPEPETPFAPDGFARGVVAAATSPSRVFGAAFEVDTPFLSEYGDGAATAAGPREELFASLLAELHAPEFEDAIADLVHETASLAEPYLAREAADPVEERAAALQGLRATIEPLRRDCEAAVDRIQEAIGNTDLASLTEAELDGLLDRASARSTTLAPAFEEFLGGFIDKARKAVTAAASLAKKGVQLATKLSPVHLILARLKGLVRPLLERVLRFALDKLPVALRPVARQLAKQLLGVGEAEARDEESDGETAAADPAELSRELDTRLAASLVDGDGPGRAEAIEQFAREDEPRSALAWRRLQRARRRFARTVTRLPPGGDPAPAVEEFVPAVLAVLKLGVSVIGRPKVVSFLADLVAKLVGRYVGEQQAQPLSRALVDAGLRAVGLEVRDAPEVAGEAIAATVEDTVNRVVQTAPETAWESEQVLDGYVREAFAQAASAHFPDAFIRPELHEASETSGAWELRPVGSASKLYKKYSRVLEATITPHIAGAVTTFGGGPLAAVLRDQLGVSAGATLRARVHLYEALAGTRLADIARHEKDVRGLGDGAREAWSLLHPLTPEAAGLLLNEPALGKAVEPRYLAERTTIQVGQRFYYLEPEDAAAGQLARAPRRGRHPRTGRTKLVIDLPAGRIRVFLYYGEAEAQVIAAAFRRHAPVAQLLAALRGGHEARIARLLSGTATRALRVVHPALPAATLLPDPARLVLRTVGAPLRRTVVAWLLAALRGELERRLDPLAGEIERAAASGADGLTVVVTISRTPWLEQLRGIFSGDAAAALRLRRSPAPSATADLAVEVRPGYVRA